MRVSNKHLYPESQQPSRPVQLALKPAECDLTEASRPSADMTTVDVPGAPAAGHQSISTDATFTERVSECDGGTGDSS